MSKPTLPFLINVINHETFRAGQCYTTFMRETPSLFQLQRSRDRATKIIQFWVTDGIVNTTGGDKPFYENREIPQFNEEKTVYGARDEFLKSWCQGLYSEDLE